MVPCKNWPSCPIMFTVHLSSFVYRRVSRIKMANNNVWVSKNGKESEREQEKGGRGCVLTKKWNLNYAFQALASGQWTELLLFWTNIFWFTKHFLKLLNALLLKFRKYAGRLILLLAKKCGLSIYRCLSNGWLISFAIALYFMSRDKYIYYLLYLCRPKCH